VPFIEQTLEKFPTLTASRLYEMVVSRGYPGAPDHFRSVVRRYRPQKPAEAYLRLRTLPGEQGQVDWASFGQLHYGAAIRPLVAFVMVLSYSRKLFVQFGNEQRMGAFLRGHCAAFDAFGGVPRIILYDNLKSAVTQRVGDAIRFNETLLSFATHYHYEPKPVAVYRGNEKGRVERAIRYVRDAFFPARTWKDLDDLNAQAAAWCNGPASSRRCPEDRSQTVAAVFEQEQGKLLPLPEHPFPVEDRVEVHTGKTPYVRFDLNDYTVPPDCVRRTLVVRATDEVVRVLDGNTVVATHARVWGKGEQVEDPAHLQQLVNKKREGRRGGGMNRLQQVVPRSRSFLMLMAERGENLGATTNGLLRLLDSYGADELERALVEAIESESMRLSSVRQVLERRRHQRDLPPALPVPLSDEVRAKDGPVRSHALSSYDDIDSSGGQDE
jgi:transposase